MSLRWYVVRSKPNNEDLLWEQLNLRRIEAFLPRIPVKPVNPRARKTKPYFPGYVFVHLDLSEVGASALQWVPGASGLVVFGNEPGYVPDNLIHAIRTRVGEIHAAGGELLRSVRAGDTVIIQDGPFKGYEAIFDERLSGSERVRVLLRLFQREAVPLHLRAGQIFCPKYGV
ncbi:MAG: transcription termination/antitermination NusG family protein [Dehalococcoidales bacterium]|jgi:transcriptional antiterminator RfaH